MRLSYCCVGISALASAINKERTFFSLSLSFFVDYICKTAVMLRKRNLLCLLSLSFHLALWELSSVVLSTLFAAVWDTRYLLNGRVDLIVYSKVIFHKVFVNKNKYICMYVYVKMCIRFARVCLPISQWNECIA